LFCTCAAKAAQGGPLRKSRREGGTKVLPPPKLYTENLKFFLKTGWHRCGAGSIGDKPEVFTPPEFLPQKQANGVDM